LFLHEEATFNAISPGNAAARAWTEELISGRPA
jgi:hypothetical protein